MTNNSKTNNMELLKTTNNDGFTLIELIVVMAIIAILVLLAAPRFLGYTKDANVTAMEQDTKVLADASEMYHVNNNEWPIKDIVKNHNVGGVDELYYLNKEKLGDSIKNISNDFVDYALSTSGDYEGEVFYLEGLKRKDDTVSHGIAKRYSKPAIKPIPIETPMVNLITNGYGEYGNNTNFKQLQYLSNETYKDKPVFLYSNITNNTIAPTEYIPINEDLTYEYTYNYKANTSKEYILPAINPFDIDMNRIRPQNHMFIRGSTSYLLKDLKKGDTKVFIADLNNWRNDTRYAHRRSIIFWNYTDSTGHIYPPETYSRNVSDTDLWSNGSINKNENYIELNQPWTGKNYKKGTEISNGQSGWIYKFVGGTQIPTVNQWNKTVNQISGIDTSGNNDFNKFPPGTVYVKPQIFLHGSELSKGDTVHISGMSFSVVE